MTALPNRVQKIARIPHLKIRIRRQLLAKLLTSWRVTLPPELVTVTDLAGLPAQIKRTMVGEQVGRVVVDLWPDHSSSPSLG